MFLMVVVGIVQGRALERRVFCQVLLMYLWVRQYPVTDAYEEAEVGEHTAIDIIIPVVARGVFPETDY